VTALLRRFHGALIRSFLREGLVHELTISIGRSGRCG
jgi:hypothetical protein